MPHLTRALALAVSTALASSVVAQPPADTDLPEGVPRGPMVRERLLRAFDKDNSGSLDDEERKTMREQLRERFERRRDDERDGNNEDQTERSRDDDARDRDRGSERRRGYEADQDRERGERDRRDRPRGFGGPRGPRGPMGGPPPPLAPLFDWFDADYDNSLSRDEFRALSDFVRRHAQRRRGGPPAGPRLFSRDPDGPRRPDRERSRGEGGDGRERPSSHEAI